MPTRLPDAQDEAHLNLISVLHYVMGGLYLLGIGFVVIHFMIMGFFLRHAEAEANKPPAISVAVTPPSASEPDVASPPQTAPSAAHPSSPPAPFPKEIIPFFIAFYVVIGFFLVVLCVCNILSGLYVRKRKNRTFSFVIAGVNCLQFPLGTALGVFTFIVLSRPAVKTDYDSRALPG